MPDVTVTPTLTISAAAPASPVAGDLWWNSAIGVFFVYYDDGSSAQWVTTQPVKYVNLAEIKAPAGGDLTGYYPDPSIEDNVALEFPVLKNPLALNDYTQRLASTKWVTDKFASSGVLGQVTEGPGILLTPNPLAGDSTIALKALAPDPSGSAGGLAQTPIITVDIYGRITSLSSAVIPPVNSPVFTGVPEAPTAGPSTNTNQLATTAFVQNVLTIALGPYAPINSPAFTGTPTVPTQGSSAPTSQIANSTWVGTYFLPLIGGTLSGPLTVNSTGNFTGGLTSGVGLGLAATGAVAWSGRSQLQSLANGQLSFLTAAGTIGGLLDFATDAAFKFRDRANGADADVTFKTQTLGTSNTTGATTAFVAAAIASGAVITVGTTPPVSPNPNQLWWNSDASAGGGQLFIYYNDGNTSQWVPASPSVQTQAGWRKIGSQTVTSPQAQVDFTSIPSDINNLKFVVSNAIPVTNDIGLGIRYFDSTGTIDTGASNYSMSGVIGGTSSMAGNAPITGYPAASFIQLVYNAAGSLVSNAAGVGFSGEGTIMNIRAGTMRRMMTFTGYYQNGSNTAQLNISGGGLWQTAGLLTGVRFFFNGGNIASGVFELWGSP